MYSDVAVMQSEFSYVLFSYDSACDSRTTEQHHIELNGRVLKWRNLTKFEHAKTSQ